MFRDKKVVVVMPAYNAAQTLQRTYDEVMAQAVVDRVIVVDDASRDETVSIAKTLPHTTVYAHEKNRGYGANQKSCYKLALEAGGDMENLQAEDEFMVTQSALVLEELIGQFLFKAAEGGGDE